MDQNHKYTQYKNYTTHNHHYRRVIKGPISIVLTKQQLRSAAFHKLVVLGPGMWGRGQYDFVAEAVRFCSDLFAVGRVKGIF